MNSTVRKTGALAALVLSLAACGFERDYAKPGETGAPAHEDKPGGSARGEQSPTRDVTLSACRNEGYGTVTARVRVRNSTRGPRSYIITAEAVRGGQRLAELNGFLNDVRPGQVAQSTLYGGDGQRLDGKFACRLVSVERF